MNERFISEELLNEMPRPLINFLWYLWEVYCDEADDESLFILQSGIIGQCITIQTTGKTVEQDLGTAIDTEILIRKEGAKHYMSRR